MAASTNLQLPWQTPLVHKTGPRLDQELLAAARAVLGTKTATETIHTALAAVVACQGRARLFQRLRSLDGIDLANEAVMCEAWR